MAPKSSKRKSGRLSTNPGSSSTLSELSDRFLSRDQADLFESYKSRSIIIERPVNLDELVTTPIENWFVSLGLSRLLSPPGVVNESLVREFYCNISSVVLEKGSPPSFKTFVRGKVLILNPTSVRSLLGFSVPAHCVFPFEDVLEHASPEQPVDLDSYSHIDFSGIASAICGKPRLWDSKVRFLKQSELSEHLRLLNLIVSFNVYPTGNNSTLTKEYCYLLHAISTGLAIDFGSLMVRHMARTASSSTALPFGLWVTFFLIMNGVRTDPSDVLGKESTPIDSKTLARSSSHMKQAVDVDAESGETPEPPPSSVDFDSMLDILGDILTSVHKFEDRCTTRLTEMEANMPISLKHAVSVAAADELTEVKGEVKALKMQVEAMQAKEMLLISAVTELKTLVQQRIPPPP